MAAPRRRHALDACRSVGPAVEPSTRVLSSVRQAVVSFVRWRRRSAADDHRRTMNIHLLDGMLWLAASCKFKHYATEGCKTRASLAGSFFLNPCSQSMPVYCSLSRTSTTYRKSVIPTQRSVEITGADWTGVSPVPGRRFIIRPDTRTRSQLTGWRRTDRSPGVFASVILNDDVGGARC